MEHVETEIVESVQIGAQIFRLTFYSPTIASEATPGQFVMMRCGSGFDPLLSRPFSIHDCSLQTGLMTILFRVVGKGTALLSQCVPGENLWVLGPLGKGFCCQPRDNVSLVGGGIGIAPLLFLAKRLKETNPEFTISALLGAATRDELEGIVHFFDIPGLSVEVATDDGTLGVHGLVTDLMHLHLPPDRSWTIHTCGPLPMLKAVVGFSRERNWSCQVSVEAGMACGLGACLGCAMEASPSVKEKGYLHVCKDGPVFWESDLLW